MTLTFKQYLLEAVQGLAEIPPELLETYGSRIQLSPEGLLIFKNRLHIDANNAHNFIEEVNGKLELKYPIEYVNTSFSVNNRKLASFKNFPRIINGDFEAYLNNFESIIGFPEKVFGNIDICSNRRLKSFSGIHKYLKECTGTFIIPGDLESGLLGLLKVKGLREVTFSWDEVSESQIPELAKACEIITNHLHSNRNIIACQEELFKNNLDQFAKL